MKILFILLRFLLVDCEVALRANFRTRFEAAYSAYLVEASQLPITALRHILTKRNIPGANELAEKQVLVERTRAERVQVLA